MLINFPEGPVSVVVDSYNIWNALTDKMGKRAKRSDREKRGAKSSLVVQPDSGEPKEIVVICNILLHIVKPVLTNYLKDCKNVVS